MKTIRTRIYDLLRKSERIFKTDMVYLAKGGFWLTAGQFITSLASFLLALLFARYISKEAYGNYKYILSLAGLLATFSLTGLSAGVLQSVARGFHGTFLEAVRMAMRWNTLIFALSLGSSYYYLSHHNTTVGCSLIIVALTFPAIKTLEIYEAYLNGQKDFRKSAIYRGVVDIGTIIATAVGLLATDSVLIIIAMNLVAQLVLDIYFFRKVYKLLPNSERHGVEHEAIVFSKHLSVQNILTNVASYMDKILLFHFLGAAEVAIYSFAAAVPQQVRGVMANFSLLASPKISSRSAKEAVDMIPQRFFISLVFLGPIVILYIILAPFLFHLLFPAYMDAVPYTRWYVLYLLILGNLSSLVLTTQKAAHEQYILTVFSSVSQIALMLILVVPFKVYGVIWAILISKFATSILSYILALRFSKRASSAPML